MAKLTKDYENAEKQLNKTPLGVIKVAELDESEFEAVYKREKEQLAELQTLFEDNRSKGVFNGDIERQLNTQANIVSQLEQHQQGLLTVTELVNSAAGKYTIITHKTSSAVEDVTEELHAQEQVKNYMRREQEAINNALSEEAAKSEHIEATTEKTETKAERMKRVLAEIQAESAQTAQHLSQAGENTNYAAAAMDKLKKRVVGLARRVFVFSVITMALRSMRTWMTKVLKTNKEASASMSKLKAALLTLAQPLVDIVVPAFIALVNVLTKVVTTLATLFAMLTGKTFEQSKAAAEALNKETEALEGTGEAAEDAQKSLASFDEINQLSFGSDKKQSSGAAETKPDFNLETKATEDSLQKIYDMVKLIGFALAGWRLGSILTDIPDINNKLTKTIGIVMALFGAIEMSQNLMDAWNNGVNFSNLSGALLGLLSLVTGLFLAFGKTGAAIGLLVGAFAMGVTAIKDMIDNGVTLGNTLMLIAALISGGLGISILTGSWIPLIITAIAAVTVGLMAWTENLDEFVIGLKNVFGGIWDMFMGFITGDAERIKEGFKQFWQGVGQMASALVKTAGDLISGLLEKLGFTRLAENVKAMFEDIANIIKALCAGDLKAAAESLLSLIKNLCAGIINGIVDLVENLLGLLQKAKDGLKSLFSKKTDMNAIKEFAQQGQQGGIMQTRLEAVAAVPSSIPRLASGAVIPPNRQFMAVLGDQRSGTNVEAPLETIKQALAEVMGQSGGRGGDIVLQIDGKTFARVTNPYLAKETTRLGTKLVQGV